MCCSLGRANYSCLLLPFQYLARIICRPQHQLLEMTLSCIIVDCSCTYFSLQIIALILFALHTSVSNGIDSQIVYTNTRCLALATVWSWCLSLASALGATLSKTQPKAQLAMQRVHQASLQQVQSAS